MRRQSDDDRFGAGDHRPSSGLERGDRLAADGDLDGAERAYRDAAAAGDATAATKLGLILESRERYDEARAAYGDADAAGDGRGAFRHGMLLARQDRWDEAQAAWSRAEQRGTELAGLDLEAALKGRNGRGPRRRRLPAPPARCATRCWWGR